MGVIESFRVALQSLDANRLRSALTMLGIIIGVGAVIGLTSVGRGAQNAVTDRIQGMGTNLLFVRPGSTQQGGVRSAAGSAPTLTMEDGEAIAEEIPTVLGVAPEAGGFVQVISQGQNLGTRIVATNAMYPSVRNHNVADGEFFTRQQVESRSLVVVLGANVARTLFGDASPVDQMIGLSLGPRRMSFRVIGVMEAKGGTGFGNQDDVVFMPITTMQERLSRQRTPGGQHVVGNLNVQVAEEREMDRTVQEIGELLRRRHRVAQDDFHVQSQQDILETANQITGIMTILLGAIAGISLLVGGIGIMNIMLVSVTERTREIGIRKAVGARWRDIMLQFLIESMVVSAVGGIVGIILGVAIARILAGLEFSGQALPAVVTADSVLTAFVVSAAVGLFFGIYPASRAARLHPIEALRYE
ncbi:MAG: ABC transporter permease [Chloroflexi bacterium]|nr:ABC transporter permease [Chloroflexota bacterium]